MTEPQFTPVRNISDTAMWVAYFRSMETQRRDALFRDPYAERLAGDRGAQIATTLQGGNKHEWAWTARTYLFDKFVMEEVQAGADLVLNLAAGLDTRPYRLGVPTYLEWIEVDLPEILSYKEAILQGETAGCRVERIRLDLLNVRARGEIFAELDRRWKRICVLTEGLLLYWTAEEVASLAKDLFAGKCFSSWVIDLVSPGQLKWMQHTTGSRLTEFGASFLFAPEEGTSFFSAFGWKPTKIEGLLKNAAKLNRAPAELLSLLPEPKGPFKNYPWTGVCLLKRDRLD